MFGFGGFGGSRNEPPGGRNPRDLFEEEDDELLELVNIERIFQDLLGSLIGFGIGDKFKDEAHLRSSQGSGSIRDQILV